MTDPAAPLPPAPCSGLLAQILEWVAARPRTYEETMEAWRTSCPRLSVWEDALADGLVTLDDRPTQRSRIVSLTPRGEKALGACAVRSAAA